MQSHEYDFAARDLLGMALPPLLPVALFALAMHCGAGLGLLPEPRPALDLDRTILLHQAEASRQSHDADLLLIGDSSCLMNVSALGLSRQSPHSALNLGTLSYLDLPALAALLRRYVEANPNRLRTVVLLMHPEALRLPGPSRYHVEVLERFHAGKDMCGPAVSRVRCALGAEVFLGRVWSRLAPQSFGGNYGRFYGFNRDLWRHLSAHRGSALDPGHFDPALAEGSAEYRLAPSLETGSRSFRAIVPEGVLLLAGITPIPESRADPGYLEVQEEMLRTWVQWLDADGGLQELPAVWPDSLFASQTHLNSRGVELYTERLARSLERAAAGPLGP